jgi:hypothetical protein
MAAHILTASWTALWRASQAGPLPVLVVRISRGLPRFWPAAERFPAVEALMPDPWMLGVAKADPDLERFGRCYRRKLHIQGLPAIQAILDTLGARYNLPLALACFEPSPTQCHRGQFAAWYERMAGIAVAEFEVEPAQLHLPTTAPAGAESRSR